MDTVGSVASMLSGEVPCLKDEILIHLLFCSSLNHPLKGAKGSGGDTKVENAFCRWCRAAVSALNDALLIGQEQVYRPLEEEVIPALKKSTTFGNFVDDLSSLEVCCW